MSKSQQTENKSKLSVDISRIRELASAPSITRRDGVYMIGLAAEIERMRKEIERLRILAGENKTTFN